MSRPCRASESLELSSDLRPREWSPRGRRALSPGGAQCAQPSLPWFSPFQAHDATTESSTVGSKTTKNSHPSFRLPHYSTNRRQRLVLKYCQSFPRTYATIASTAAMSQPAPSGVSLTLL